MRKCEGFTSAKRSICTDGGSAGCDSPIMALEQKLHLKLSQKLIMTPSLQQAIKLLQLSKLELQEVLNQELLENPLLEESAEEAKSEEAEADAQEKTQDT